MKKDTKKKTSRVIVANIVLWGALVVGFIVVYSIIRYFVNKPPKAKPLSYIPVSLSRPKRGLIANKLIVSGNIQTDDSVVISPRSVTGTLMRLYVDVGDHVREGQVIAIIDPSTYRLQLNQAQADYQQAKSQWTRTKSLFASGGISKQDYDTAKASYINMQSTLAQARLMLSYTKVKSKITGRVLQKNSSEGSIVSPDTAIITVGDLTDLVIEAKVPEERYAQFEEEMGSIQISIDVPALKTTKSDGVLKGRILRIEPFISTSDKSFTVKVAVKDTTGFARPGMYAKTTFIVSHKNNTLRLPNRALVGNKFLWYMDPVHYTAHQIPFQPVFQDANYMEIPAQYSDYLFLINGQNFVKEGSLLAVNNFADVKGLKKEKLSKDDIAAIKNLPAATAIASKSSASEASSSETANLAPSRQSTNTAVAGA